MVRVVGCKHGAAGGGGKRQASTKSGQKAPGAYPSSASSYQKSGSKLRRAITPRTPLFQRNQRLFRMGTFISGGLDLAHQLGHAQAKAGSTLILKWYMLCRAWWSSLRKVILPLGRVKAHASMVRMSLLVLVSPLVALRAVTSAMAGEAPAVKKSGGALNCL